MQIGMKFGTPGVYSIWRNRFAFIRSAEEHETSKAVHHNENYISGWNEILFKYLQYNYDRNSSFVFYLDCIFSHACGRRYF